MAWNGGSRVDHREARARSAAASVTKQGQSRRPDGSMQVLWKSAEVLVAVAAAALSIAWILYDARAFEPWIGLLTTLLVALEVTRRILLRQKVYLPKNREEFYRYYAERTKEATREIWLTTDGYNMENPTSRRFGRLMLQARRTALENGVSLQWFQVIQTMHLNWITYLQALSEEYPLRLFVYVNPVVAAVPNVCVIDPDAPRSVTERMEHRTGLLHQGSRALTATFYLGDRERAKRTRELVEELIAHPSTRLLRGEAFDDLRRELFRERLEKLQAWAAERGSVAPEDLRASGVFDEQVISAFIGEAGG